MKFNGDKDKVIYYWEKAKMFKEAGNEEAYIEYLKKANELKEKIERDNQKKQ